MQTIERQGTCCGLLRPLLRHHATRLDKFEVWLSVFPWKTWKAEHYLSLSLHTLFVENWNDMSHMWLFNIPGINLLMLTVLASSSVTFQNAKWLKKKASAIFPFLKLQKQEFTESQMFFFSPWYNFCLLVVWIGCSASKNVTKKVFTSSREPNWLWNKCTD